MLNFKSYSPSKRILLCSLICLFYIVFIVYPFLANYSYTVVDTVKWKFRYAQLFCFLLYLPSVIFYLYLWIKYLYRVKLYRYFVYPVFYVTLFILLNFGLLIILISQGLFWYFLFIAFPLWFIGLIITFLVSLYYDIKDRKELKLKKWDINSLSDPSKESKIKYIIFIILFLFLCAPMILTMGFEFYWYVMNYFY